MGMISDVTTFEVVGQSPVSVGVSNPTLEISVEAAPSLDISTESYTIGNVEVQVSGPQGVPGVQNVYVQPNDPSVEFGWGIEEANYIWIRTT